MYIRVAQNDDAKAICNVLTRSVREVCAPDYNFDTEILDLWCQNKTSANILQWIQNQENYFIVALNSQKALVGTGLLDLKKGKIILLYLIPDSLKQGFGTKLYQELEKKAKEIGHLELTLESTITALPFYQKQGFLTQKDHLAKGKIPSFFMKKTLL